MRQKKADARPWLKSLAVWGQILFYRDHLAQPTQLRFHTILARELPYMYLRSPLTIACEVAFSLSLGRPVMMHKHLEDILRTIAEAQRQLAEVKKTREEMNSDLEDYEDAVQGLAWVKKKLENLAAKKSH